jgi:hypothetical protein
MGSDEGRVVGGARWTTDELDDVLPARAAPDADRRGVRPATAEV